MTAEEDEDTANQLSERPADHSSSRERSNEPADDIDILQWDGLSDPGCPYNWSAARKWFVAGVSLIGTLVLPVNGTSITVASDAIASQFHVTDTSAFTNSYWTVTSWSLGGAFVVVAGLPLLEDTGVRPGYLITYVFLLLMIVPQALAQNFATLIVTRFFSGGCVALLANSIASMIPDLWQTEESRTIPVSIYILLYLMGNTLGPPMFSGVIQFIGNWRWIFYIQLIIYSALLPLFICSVRETRHDIILRRRAKQIRRKTGETVDTKHEVTAVPFRQTVWRVVIRPLYLLSTEPLLFVMMLWSAFGLGLVFLFTQSVEQVFRDLYGWPTWSCGYVQIAVVIGQLAGWSTTLYGIRLFLRSAERNDETPGRPIPEARLYVSVFGSFVGMTGGMFVYAWTSFSWLPWIVPAIGLGMVGFGNFIVVYAATEYVTDAYAPSKYNGSALAAVAFGENIVCGFIPLASESMYTNLGFQWASTLLGFLALLLSFAPVIFIWQGRRLRERSPFMMAGGQKGTILD